MKIFLKALAGLAILLAITGCPNGSGGSTKVIPIESVTVMDGASELAEGSTINLNAGETKALTASSSDAAAEITWRSGNNNVVSVAGGVLTGIGAGTATITCTATNDSGGSKAFTFNVTVNPKLTEMKIYYVNEEVSYTSEIELNPDTDIELHVVYTPEGAEGEFDWASDSNTGVTITASEAKPSSYKVIRGTADASAVITVTPLHAGLTQAEQASLAKTFTVRMRANIVATPVTSLAVQTADGSEIEYNPGGITLKRGRTVTLTAVPDVTEGTSVQWSSDSAVVAIDDDEALTVELGADEGDAGGSAIITVSAGNSFNDGAGIEKKFKVTVPERGNVIFEWIAEENPDDTDFPGLTVRNYYPGFRDIYLGTGGSGQNSNGYIPYNGDGFTGLRLGNISGSSPNNGNLLLMIGTALDAAKIGPKYTVTNASSTEAGTLDLSGPVRLTFEFAETAFTGYFRVYVNNNSTGAANSFLGNYSQYVHLPLADFRSAAALDDPAVPEGSGSYSCIIDYTEGNLLITPNNPAAVNLSPAQRNDLETAFIALHVQNNTGYINITSIKVENIAAASITVGREADFAGFPETLTLGSAESEIITLTGSGFSGADWYIDGIQKVTGTKTYTVTGLAAGEHSLTAIVTVNGKLYSKTVKFTVAE